MTKRHAYVVVGWAAALTLVAVLVIQLAHIMPGRWSVAFWTMIAAVLAAEFLAKTRFKVQIAKVRGLEMALDIVSMAVAAIACYVFARHFYPGV